MLQLLSSSDHSLHAANNSNSIITPHRVVCIAFLLLGLGHLLPWVTLIAAIDWWHFIYREDIEYNDSIEYNLSIYYHTSLFISMILSTLYTINKQHIHQSIHNYKHLKHTIYTIRVNFIVMLISLLSILAFTWYTPPLVLFILTSIIGLSEGLIRCEIYSMTARIKTTDYTTSLMIGHCIAGLVTCILRISTKLIFHHTKQTIQGLYTSVVVYFVIAGIILLISIIVISSLAHNSLLLKELHIKTPDCTYDHKQEQDNQNNVTTNEDDNQQIKHSISINTPLLSSNDNHHHKSYSTENLNNNNHMPYELSLTYIIKLFYQSAIFVLINFCITISIYPGLVTSLPTVDHYFSKSWYAIILITLYNVGDMLGRLICYIPMFSSKINTKHMYIFITLRGIIMLPLIIIHVCFKVSKQYKHNWFASDIITYIVILLFGLTNGQLGTSLFIHAPIDVRKQLNTYFDNVIRNDNENSKQQMNYISDTDSSTSNKVRNKHEEINFALTFVGRSMALSLCTGTVIGSYVGLVVRYILSYYT